MAKTTVVPSTIGVSLTNLSTLTGSGGVGSVVGSLASVVGGAVVVTSSVEVTIVVGVPVVGGAVAVASAEYNMEKVGFTCTLTCFTISTNSPVFGNTRQVKMFAL